MNKISIKELRYAKSLAYSKYKKLFRHLLPGQYYHDVYDMPVTGHNLHAKLCISKDFCLHEVDNVIAFFRAIEDIKAIDIEISRMYRI